MVVKSVMNIQDSFLNQARREKVALNIHLLDGSDLHGKISAFDNFTVILINDEREEQYLIYKHAIATVFKLNPFKFDFRIQRVHVNHTVSYFYNQYAIFVQ